MRYGVYIYIYTYMHAHTYMSSFLEFPQPQKILTQLLPQQLGKGFKLQQHLPGNLPRFQAMSCPQLGKVFQNFACCTWPCHGASNSWKTDWVHLNSNDSEGLCYLGRMVPLGFHWLHSLFWRWLSIGLRCFDLCFWFWFGDDPSLKSTNQLLRRRQDQYCS